MSIEYLAWRCTWQSAESAARAAWENSEHLYKQLQAANQRIAELESGLGPGRVRLAKRRRRFVNSPALSHEPGVIVNY